ncbi:zinc finger protein [Forsythia ovata]|uniref:Zinc finger protein n=1 Tax=Forsythia ovata TaxID=205694 RepID=A0ABD1WFH6_9LAMI
MKELKRDHLQHAIKIQYQVMENGPLIEICSDSLVYFYIQVKKTESNLTKFPLCVDDEKVVCIKKNQICLGNAVTGEDNIGHSQKVRMDNSLYDCFSISSIPKLPSIEEMGTAICEYVAFPNQDIDDNESDVIYRPSVEDVKRNAVLPSSDSAYQVNDDTTSYLVRIDDKICSCNRFQIDEMPCPHAISVLGGNNMLIYDYCSPYYSKESYLGTYTLVQYVRLVTNLIGMYQKR